MDNNGYILANEWDKIRYERLKFNCNIQGANIVEVINRRGEKLGNDYEGQFDRVLLDAPCSGEGRFVATSMATYKGWSIKKVNELVKLQKKLLESAVRATKSNGIIVYSTCTINRYENEQIIDWGIHNLGISLEPIDLEINNTVQGDTGRLYNTLGEIVKILPSKTMEGFFVAKLRKVK